jgi:hypothetical protein
MITTKMKGFSPFPRKYFTATLVEEDIYVFGGWTSEALNDMVIVRLSDNGSFETIETSGMIPSQRYLHAAALFQNKIFVIGGTISDDSMGIKGSQIYSFNIETKGWTRTPMSSFVVPRYGHSATTIDSVIYIFGGVSEEGKFINALTVFDPIHFTMNVIKCDFEPSCRAFHTATAIDSCLYVFGGQTSDGYSNELWIYDVVLMKWTSSNGDFAPSPRIQHGMSSFDSYVLIMGGIDSHGIVKNDLHIFDVHYGWVAAASIRHKFHEHQLIHFGSKMYILGGFGSVESDFHSIKVLDISKFQARLDVRRSQRYDIISPISSIDSNVSSKSNSSNSPVSSTFSDSNIPSPSIVSFPSSDICFPSSSTFPTLLSPTPIHSFLPPSPPLSPPKYQASTCIPETFRFSSNEMNPRNSRIIELEKIILDLEKELCLDNKIDEFQKKINELEGKLIESKLSDLKLENLVNANKCLMVENESLRASLVSLEELVKKHSASETINNQTFLELEFITEKSGKTPPPLPSREVDCLNFFSEGKLDYVRIDNNDHTIPEIINVEESGTYLNLEIKSDSFEKSFGFMNLEEGEGNSLEVCNLSMDGKSVVPYDIPSPPPPPPPSLPPSSRPIADFCDTSAKPSPPLQCPPFPSSF